MKHAILHFRDRHLPEQGPEKPVSVALVTGSLGPGGAERQLTRLAGELTRLAEQPGQVPLDLLPKPEKVEVLVKQHTEPSGSAKKQGLDFFLPVLVKAQIPVTEINKLPPVSVSHQSVPEGRLGRLLEQLPPPVHYGVTRLAPVLRTNPFDVVSLWQDGTCLFARWRRCWRARPPSTWCSEGCRRTSARTASAKSIPSCTRPWPRCPACTSSATAARRPRPIRNGSASPSCASMCCTTACRILPPTPPPRTRTNGGRSRKTRPMPRKPSAACSAWNRTNGRSCGSSSRRSA